MHKKYINTITSMTNDPQQVINASFKCLKNCSFLPIFSFYKKQLQCKKWQFPKKNYTTSLFPKEHLRHTEVYYSSNPDVRNQA